MKPVLIFGAGQVAQVFAESLARGGKDTSYPVPRGLPWHAMRYRVAAFVVDASHWEPGRFVDDIPVVAYEHIHMTLPAEDHSFVIGMSFRGLNAVRAEKFSAMKSKGYEPFAFVDHDARVATSANIGRGSFVMGGNEIQTSSEIGENCILWSNNHIGHHTRIDSHVFIASGVTIGGGVEVGERSFIGVGATIRDNVKIGARCVIGAGALILSDCEADGVYSPGGTDRSKVPSHRLRGI